MSVFPHSIRVLTVDDHRIFRDGLAMVLATKPDMNLVAQASNLRKRFSRFVSATRTSP
jgi:DNA-binding NarL/FixJ family response regulator